MLCQATVGLGDSDQARRKKDAAEAASYKAKEIIAITAYKYITLQQFAIFLRRTDESLLIYNCFNFIYKSIKIAC